ncbi:hypothetical protein DND132_2145 [Pseudodesulfovibrio mercurii]|uniref:Uncharacterized protein n=1 Tax=Pseudodesulfovibrio mercurii TaxID=641491 RepID=F0JI39_9BACT|nr:hypothetical protein [Pseudodesulfovibrio mercurii]EGB15350.1 hypothetical protein DND132_2145 [Pseudodesulfovibrio mercurii]
MNHASYRRLLLLGALTLLPGCLAANAALGVFGLMGPPVAQLAGAAYTVAECSYEYGVNDRTPDQVFLAKFDWLLEDGEGNEPAPAAFAGALRRTVDGPTQADAPQAVAVAKAAPKTGNRTGPVAEPVAEPVAVAATIPVKNHTVAPKRAVAAVAPARPVPNRIAPVPRRTVPAHTYVVHEPDPLLARLDRLESGLAQAERLYLSRSEVGLRLSVPPCDGDPCAQGVNGGSSLRLPVTYTAPAMDSFSTTSSLPPVGDRAGQPRPPSGRSLNT